MISSSYEAEGERFTKVRCTMKNPCMFQRGSAPIDWSIDRTIASRFGASFMPPGRSMFSAKMTAPVGVSTQPTHQPICGSTRACHPVFALRINRARPRRS